ncbi:cytochrome c biogenesis protein/redoxin [Rickettsiales bacterium LUAb2]
MLHLLINYGLAFLEGVALITSPCILPIFPLLFAKGVSGSRSQPVGIIIGFTFIFALFTFFANSLVSLIDINLDLLRFVAFILIVILGVIMFFDYLSNKFNLLTQKISNWGINFSSKYNNNDLISGIIFGGLISLIWAPCGGPILTAAIIQMSVQKNILAIVTFFFFALGSIVPMIIMVIFGRVLLTKLTFLNKKTFILRKVLALLIIIGALITAFSSDVLASDNTSLENNNIKVTDIINGIEPVKAPDLIFDQNNPWLNSPNLTLQKLKGKVVLIEFWSYSCPYCRKTIPYLKNWYSKYHKNGLEIIAIHSPQYSYASSIPNVKKAIKKFDIKYPVLIDNQYKNFVNYEVQAWPTIYLLNKKGEVVYFIVGKGDEDITEKNIQTLLNEK